MFKQFCKKKSECRSWNRNRKSSGRQTDTETERLTDGVMDRELSSADSGNTQVATTLNLVSPAGSFVCVSCTLELLLIQHSFTWAKDSPVLASSCQSRPVAPAACRLLLRRASFSYRYSNIFRWQISQFSTFIPFVWLCHTHTHIYIYSRAFPFTYCSFIRRTASLLMSFSLWLRIGLPRHLGLILGLEQLMCKTLIRFLKCGPKIGFNFCGISYEKIRTIVSKGHWLPLCGHMSLKQLKGFYLRAVRLDCDMCVSSDMRKFVKSLIGS